MMGTSRAVTAATSPQRAAPGSPWRVALLPDGGQGVGLGHWRRCLTLAGALREVGLHPGFHVRDNVLRDLCLQAGFEAVVSERASGGFASGPMPPTIFACVVDSYRIGAEELAALRDRVGCLVCFDDLCAGPIPADLVINGAPDADGMGYPPTNRTVYLLGPSYFMLRPDLGKLQVRSTKPSIEEILVTVGGGDDHHLLPRLVRWVRQALPEVTVIHCIVGPYSDSSPLEDPGDCESVSRTVLHRHPFDLAGLLGRVDAAITGGGQSACELAACGVPAVGIRLSDDQRFNLRGLARASALVEAGAATDPDMEGALISALRSIRSPEARLRMTAKGRTLYDGQGARRVAEAILSLVGSRV